MRRLPVLLMPCLLALGACDEPQAPPKLEIVAESQNQWTGVAVSKEGRLFVNFPRWSDDVPVSVAEWKDGKPVPYPNAEWNQWTGKEDPAKHFVCVQSVTVDDRNRLWILDPANPKFAGVVPGGPKLLRVDLTKNTVERVYTFDAKVAPRGSYLNDMRVDTSRDVVYISDSGAGAIVVLDGNTGQSRRLLADHPSTKAEAIDIVIEGSAWKRGGKTPQVHADGIALSPDRKWVYFQALTGKTMYRIPAEALLDERLDPKKVPQCVEKVATSGVADGIAFGPDGHLYLSSLEENAINRLTPKHERQRVVFDERLRWPDSFAVGADGWIYVTTAQIHLGPSRKDPYRIWRFRSRP